ncbi:MAG: hypothetical protein J5I90_05230 [Caldilineales bacterium]|nr:hypothetical protein [Caldilineales bacterium]
MNRLDRVLFAAGALIVLALLAVTMRSAGGVGAFSPSGAPMMPHSPNGRTTNRAILVRGDLAYIMSVGSSVDGIAIFDIANPLSPQQLAVIPHPEEGVWRDFDVVSDRLYAFEQIENLSMGIVHIFDVSTPSIPVEVARFDGPGLWGFGVPGSIRASEDNLYLHLSESSTWPAVPMQIYDISELRQPELVATYGGDCRLGAPTLAGQRAYVRMSSCEGDPSYTFYMAVYDLTDPESPVLVSDEHLRELTLGLSNYDVRQEVLYVQTWENLGGKYSCRIRIIDVADPAQSVLLGEIEWISNVGCGGGMQVQGGLLYYTDPDGIHTDWNVLQAYDVRDPEDILAVSRYQLPRQSNFFTPFDLKDGCAFWISHDGTTGLYTMCTAGVAAATPTPTAIPDLKQYMPLISAG